MKCEKTSKDSYEDNRMVTKRKITNNVDDEFNVKWKTPLCIVILFLNMDNTNIIQNEQ